jgi:2'-5' RNA ligase
MSLMRVFIAIALPPHIKKLIVQHSATLQQQIGEAARWVSPENIHITLKFLGDVAPPEIAPLTTSLAAKLAEQPQILLKLGHLGIFPSLQRPRILWLGVQANQPLQELQKIVEATTRGLGYLPDAKPFSPHLTLGRVKDNLSAVELQKIKNSLGTKQVDLPGEILVDSVHLFRSDLQPKGPLYTSLFRAPLSPEKPEQIFTR